MKKKIAVFAGNEVSREKEKFYLSLAYKTGQLLANNDFIVVSGGGPGLMNEVMRGAYENGGKTIAICLHVSGRKQTEFATEKLIYYTLNERQNKLISIGEAFISLPGGIGTLYEIAAILALKRKMEISRNQPLILIDSYFQHFDKMIKFMIQEGFVDPTLHSFYNLVNTPEEAVKILKDSYL